MRHSLSVMGLRVMTVTEVKGFGGQAQTLVYRGVKIEAPYLMEAKVELAVPDEMTESAVALIQETAKKDPSGKSRIVVFPMEEVGTARVSSVAA